MKPLVSQVGEIPDRSSVKAFSRRVLFRRVIKEQYMLQPQKVTKKSLLSHITFDNDQI